MEATMLRATGGLCGAQLHNPRELAETIRHNAGGEEVAALTTMPEKVAIICLGVSMHDYIREAMTTARFKQPYDEVWTLNRGIRSFHHDKLFVMDDMRWLAKKDKHYGEFFRKHQQPIITSTVYPEYPSAVAYPYAAVYEKIGDDIFNVNTVAYMVGFALWRGVKEISIFGADFFYPNGNTAEAGGQAVAFLLGLGKFHGMTFKIPGSSTLMYAHKVKPLPQGGMGRPPYGWHRRDELTEEEKGVPQHAAG